MGREGRRVPLVPAGGSMAFAITGVDAPRLTGDDAHAVGDRRSTNVIAVMTTAGDAIGSRMVTRLPASGRH